MFFRRSPKEVKPSLIYDYISTQHKPVSQMCKALNISESGYYRHLRKKDKPDKNELLLAEIKKVLAQHIDNDNYGIYRMQLAILNNGIKAGRRRIYEVMKKAGLIHKKSRRSNGITKADKEAQKSENIIGRDFSAENPNEKWLTDITEVGCRDGKLYVSPILDCYDGQIVGLTIDDHMRKELCIEAFENACRLTGASGMILHSDRGSQYTSGAFRDSLAKHGAIQSMSGTGRCYDNARMESFFATLKKEKLYRIHTERLSKAEVKTIIFRYIMIYYNRQRIYTSNPGGMPPSVYRAATMAEKAA